MPPSKSVQARAKRAIPTLLKRHVTIQRDGTTKNVSLMPLSMLIFEAARRYLADPKQFGTTANTLDLALKPALAVMFATEKQKSTFKAGLAVYEKLADQVPTTVAGQSLRAYCAGTPSQAPLQEVWEALRDTKGLHLKELPLPVEAGDDLVSSVKMRAIVSLDGIECKSPAQPGLEISDTAPGHGLGDEVYFTTAGAVSGKEGHLENTWGLSPVTKLVGSGPPYVSSLTIPGGNLKYPVYYDLKKEYMVPKPLPVYSVNYSFTLWEHDYSEEERLQAIVDACGHLSDALSSLCGNNYTRFAYYLAAFYRDIAIWLDGDDPLGRCYFQFDNICNMPLQAPKDTTVTFKGDDYEYIVRSHFQLDPLP